MTLARLWKNGVFYYHHDGWKRHWLQHPIQLNFEIGRSSPAIELAFGGGYTEGIQFHAGFGWGLWLTLKLPARWLPQQERVFGLSWYAGRLDIEVGYEPLGDLHSGRWKLWDFEWIVGKNRHEHRILMPAQRHTLKVGWWDGDEYQIDISLEERKWRNRIRTITQITYQMNVPEGERAPPFPGKGENSWDCGDDGLYGAGVGINSVARRLAEPWKLGDPRLADEVSLSAALQHFAGIVERNRTRYGSRHWRPDYLKEEVAV